MRRIAWIVTFISLPLCVFAAEMSTPAKPATHTALQTDVKSMPSSAKPATAKAIPATTKSNTQAVTTEIPKPPTPMPAKQLLMLRQGAPHRYVIKQGDTLWSIAERYLANPWEWERLLEQNPHIQTAQHLFPGDVLILRTKAGKPQLLVQHDPKPQPKVRRIKHPISTIRLSQLSPLLSESFVLDNIDDLPHIVGIDHDYMSARTNSIVYVAGLPQKPYRKYHVFHLAGAYTDPDNNKKILGYAAEDAGSVRIIEPGNHAKALVTRIRREFGVGDYLLPSHKNRMPLLASLSAPKSKINGKVINIMDGLHTLGRHDLIVLDVGSNEGVRPGNVLALYEKKADKQHSFFNRKSNVDLPQAHIGEVVVFRAFDHVSYALVMHADRDASLLDEVRNP